MGVDGSMLLLTKVGHRQQQQQKEGLWRQSCESNRLLR